MPTTRSPSGSPSPFFLVIHAPRGLRRLAKVSYMDGSINALREAHNSVSPPTHLQHPSSSHLHLFPLHTAHPRPHHSLPALLTAVSEATVPAPVAHHRVLVPSIPQTYELCIPHHPCGQAHRNPHIHFPSSAHVPYSPPSHPPVALLLPRCPFYTQALLPRRRCLRRRKQKRASQASQRS